MTLDTPLKYYFFIMLKLPSAFLCGVRVRSIDDQKCTATVRHRWINKNPFGSLYFAVQAMAAEITTGALVMRYIQNSGNRVSMLVVSNKSKFLKKASGKIRFECDQGQTIPAVLQKAVEDNQRHTFWLKSIGYDEENQVVAEMDFEWSIKVSQ